MSEAVSYDESRARYEKAWQEKQGLKGPSSPPTPHPRRITLKSISDGRYALTFEPISHHDETLHYAVDRLNASIFLGTAELETIAALALDALGSMHPLPCQCEKCLEEQAGRAQQADHAAEAVKTLPEAPDVPR